jgi:hypothetical protein
MRKKIIASLLVLTFFLSLSSAVLAYDEPICDAPRPWGNCMLP